MVNIIDLALAQQASGDIPLVSLLGVNGNDEVAQLTFPLSVDYVYSDELRDAVSVQWAELPASSLGVTTFIGLDAVGGLIKVAPFGVNAQNYGIKPSNTAAQNSVALSALVTLLMATTSGATVFFPAGQYQFDPASQVQFPKVLGKYIELVGEWSSTSFHVGNSGTVAAFYVGDPVLSGGAMGFKCRNIKFVGASATSGIAFKMEWGNAVQFENCYFTTMKQSMQMTSSYGVQYVSCIFENIGSSNVYSSTHCHHLVFDRCSVYSAGVAGVSAFLYIDTGVGAPTDNLVMRDCDFEQCRQIVNSVSGLTSFVCEGNYVEYTAVDAFDFGTGCYGAYMSNNWIALGLAFTFHNWIGGEFSRNRLYNQNIAFGSDCIDIHVADTYVTGTSVLTTALLMHTISAFLNGATANATYPPKYSKSDGIVQLHGQVDNCPGGGAPVFNLPVGYRPLQAGCWPAVKSDNITFRAVIVDPSNGVVVPSSPATESIRLDGVMFRVAN